MANNEILLKSASGQLIGAFKSNFYDVNGNTLTYKPVLDKAGWTTWTLSGDLYRLGEYCIYNTDAERVILPDSLTVIDGNAISNNNSLTTLTIPDSVTTINDWAVMNCSELTTLFIGSGIQTIGANGFRTLNKLNSITITATTPPATSNYSFCEVPSNGTLYAPNDSYQAWVNDRYLLNGWTLEIEGGDIPSEPMVIQFIGDWLKLSGESYTGIYPSNGGSFTVVWNSDTEIDVSLCRIEYYTNDGSNILPAYLVSETISSNRVERTYWAPCKYYVWGIYGGSINVDAFYGDNKLATLSYDSEYTFMFPDAMGIVEVRQGNATWEIVKKGAVIGYGKYSGELYDRTPGAFIAVYDDVSGWTKLSLLTIHNGIELTGSFAKSSSQDASVFLKAKNILSIDFIDGYSHRHDEYRYYIMPSIGLGETRMIKVRVSSNNGFPVTGEKVTGRLQYNTTTITGVNKVSYTDYGTYTEVDFELNLNTYHDYVYFLVSYEDDNYLLTDKSSTGNLGTIYPTNILGFGVESLRSTIPSEIEEETDIPISVTYPNGGNLTFDAPEDVIITIDSETDNGNGTTTATGTIRVNQENTASQITISISDGTNTINKTITILEKEPPMAAPTISINPYADLSFPQGGGIKYITITYENTSQTYINQPVAAAGIQIKAERTTETDTGVEIYYSITVPSTTNKRLIPLTFSCLSPSGLSSTNTFYAVQEGQTQTDEYCWINANPTHLTFEATGGTQRVEVRAGYPDINKPITAKAWNSKKPTVQVSWCTPNFVSRVYSDDSTEVVEQWDIVASDHSQITEPFMADIIFSYTNSYGNSDSYTCTATIKAGDGEAQASKIEAYRTIMRFDANGVFDYSEPVCTVAYHWIDEVDIKDPVVSADWIVVTEGTHKSTAGKIEIPWHIAVGKNTSPNDRTGTVTFSAIGMNDEELSVVMTVMQGGADIKDETLEYVDLLWKDCEVELGDNDMTFELLDERYNVFYTGRCQKRPLGEKNTFLINKIVQDYVWMEEIPALLNGTAEYQEHVNGYRNFRLNTPDTVGAMRSFYFKYDWSYQEGSPFVLSESIIPYVVEGQKNMITYCNLDYNKPRTDTYTWIKSDGSVVTEPISADKEEYATKVITMPENADYYVLGGQRYEVLSPCRAKYVLYYLSPKGGWCWFPIMGKVNTSDRLTTFTLSKNYDNTTAQFGKTRYTVDIATDYELSTGWLTESQSLRMWEMLESNMAYLHDMEKDAIFPVVMKSDTVEKKRHQRGQQKMLSYTFNVESSQGRMRM